VLRQNGPASAVLRGAVKTARGEVQRQNVPASAVLRGAVMTAREDVAVRC